MLAMSAATTKRSKSKKGSMNKDQIIKEHYRKIAKKGGEAVKKKKGKKYFKEIGRLGGLKKAENRKEQ